MFPATEIQVPDQDVLSGTGGSPDLLMPNMVWLAELLRGAAETASSPAIALGIIVAALAIGTFITQAAPRFAIGLIEEARGSQMEPPPLFGAAECMQCGHELSRLERIPVVSWLLQSGRCKACGSPIGLVYPATEIATVLAVALPLIIYPGQASTLPLMAVGILLVACAATDAFSELIPDRLSLALLWTCLVLAALGLGTVGAGTAILGTAFAWSMMRAIDALPFGGSGALGGGDIKMAAGIGALLGPAPALASIVAAFTMGMLAAKLGLVARDDGTMRFGPFLAAAALLALYMFDYTR